MHEVNRCSYSKNCQNSETNSFYTSYFHLHHFTAIEDLMHSLYYGYGVQNLKKLENISFLTSSPSFDSLSENDGVEVALVGRSNSGKSSILNTLTGQKALARTSSKPGKTRHINLFSLNETGDHRLVDLPGYGYARVGGAEMKHWSRELTSYITRRECLRGVIIVMDIRHPLSELDAQMLELCNSGNRAVHLLLNKSDKIRKSQKTSILHKVQQDLNVIAPHASLGTFSSLKKEGVDGLQNVVNGWFDMGSSVIVD